MGPTRAAAITIDVDSLHHYRAIHGLAAEPIEDDPIYTTAMERFWTLLDRVGVPATLFLIGRDAPHFPRAFDGVESTASEVASHSYSHDYRLIEKSPAEITADLELADEALRPLNGGRPLVGFRAPGYNISAPLMRAVSRLGYRYDSSYLPSPPYFGARWAAIFGYALAGRPSRSLAGDYRQFFAKLAPHYVHPEAPFAPHPNGALLELPMACAPLSRLPVIGTSWVMAPRVVQSVLLRRVLGNLDCVTFEMHAIDLLDETDHPALAELATSQRDLRVPVSKKMTDFERLFRKLKAARPVMTLADLSLQTGAIGVA